MSTVAERARAEADAVEAAEAEQGTVVDDGTDNPPEPEPTAFAGPPPMAPEKMAAALEKEANRHERELHKIIGEDGLFPCDKCGSMGFTNVPPEAMPEPLAAKGIIRCAVCNGWGRCVTPSLADGHDSITCMGCQGNGYRVQEIQVPTPQYIAPQAFPGAEVAYIPAPQGVPDQWGRPAGHPHYGLNPAQVGG